VTAPVRVPRLQEIPAPPPDLALPGLAVALGEDAGAVLAEALLRPEYDLVGCRPCYLRYKPGQSCLVLYRLVLRGAGGQTLERLSHLRFYAGSRAQRIWSRRPIHALADRVRRTEPEAPLRPAAQLPLLGAIAQAYPVDLALPGLSRLAGDLVRYKPARKALLHRNGRFVKLYADDRGVRAFAAGRELHAAQVPVVEPLGYFSQLRALLHPAASGEPLSSLRASPRYLSAVEETGAALARIHAAGVRALPLHSWRSELAAAAWAVGVARPDLEKRARRLAEHLTRLLETSSRKPVTVHGDFYHDQVLVTPAGPRVLDLDRVARGDPLLDLGTFVAHRDLADGINDAAAVALLNGYEPDDFDGRDLLVAQAAALLKLAIEPFRRLDTAWPDEVERRLLLAEQQLTAGVSHATPISARTVQDPALSHLAELTDAKRAARLLAETYREPVEVLDVAIIRHRPGRRCTLRYELLLGEQPSQRFERVYAKTYASERAQRVYGALAALAALHGSPQSAVTPEPTGWSRRLRLVLQREVEGEPVTPRLAAGDEILARRIADALHALHESAAMFERLHQLDDELAILDRRIAQLPARLSDRAAEAQEAAAAIARGRAWRSRPIHRDFYHDQILLDAHGRVGVLDFDDAAMSEPAMDVANLLAHLRLLARDEPAAAGGFQRAASAFRARYSTLDGELDAELLRVLEATTLLRLACIHRPRRGDAIAEELIGQALALATRTTSA
jgi:aminoglycoside phosphotransferase (APT) family kinase protein